MNLRILIAVDASEASEEAVRYVGRLFESSEKKPSIVLFHTVPRPPRPLRGAGVMGTLGPVSITPDQGGPDLVEYAEAQARPVLTHMLEILRQHDMDLARVDSIWYVARRTEDLEDEVLAEAQRLGCETIVVGRQALPWYKELLHVHVADRLARHAESHTLWIVERARADTEPRRPLNETEPAAV